jgi:Ala-tRNA(Pro) deacylase
MESVKSKILNYLKGNDCNFNEINHKPAASAEEYHNELQTRYEQQAKALFVRYKKPGLKSYAIITLQAQKKCDLNEIKRLLNAAEIRMADVSQLQAETGCNFGELPPFAKPFGFQLLMDKELLNENLIYFNCGDLCFSLSIDPKEVQRIEEPILF